MKEILFRDYWLNQRSKLGLSLPKVEGSRQLRSSTQAPPATEGEQAEGDEEGSAGVNAFSEACVGGFKSWHSVSTKICVVWRLIILLAREIRDERGAIGVSFCCILTKEQGNPKLGFFSEPRTAPELCSKESFKPIHPGKYRLRNPYQTWLLFAKLRSCLLEGIGCVSSEKIICPGQSIEHVKKQVC